jgi:nitrogen regulatory protein PII 2
MKEIYAIIREQKTQEMKNSLEDEGFSSVTIFSVEGRGRQKGLEYEIDPELLKYESSDKRTARLSYIPKRMLYLVVVDEDADKVVDIIEKENKTGYIGDGKIFICPIDEVIRVRTGEKENKAL